MTSQFEELVVASHLTCSQKLFPDFLQFRFGPALRLFISSTPIRMPFWLRQRAPIQASRWVGDELRWVERFPNVGIDETPDCSYWVTRLSCWYESRDPLLDEGSARRVKNCLYATMYSQTRRPPNCSPEPTALHQTVRAT